MFMSSRLVLPLLNSPVVFVNREGFLGEEELGNGHQHCHQDCDISCLSHEVTCVHFTQHKNITDAHLVHSVCQLLF